jgi:hypothetical protein
MSIVLQSSGGGSVTIAEPATASNFTATLPAVTGDIVVSGTTPTLNGITFPATQVPSADANTLDDYEEGTWTPVIAQNGGGGTFNYSFQSGFYTKIGNTVFASITLKLSSVSGMNGDFIYISLPFNIGSMQRQPITLNIATGLSTYFSAQANSNSANTFYVSCLANLTNNQSDVLSTNLTTNTTFAGVLIYKV